MKNKVIETPTAFCKMCNEPFLLTRKHREFCSDGCRYSWHNVRRKKALALAIKRGELE